MEEKLLEIRYNMTLDEIAAGFKQFWNKYQLKRTIIFTIVYAVAFVLGADMVIRNLSNVYGYIIMGIAAGMIFYSWYRPVQIKNKMLDTLSSLAEENYITEIYPSKIRITTCIIDDTAEENSDKVENFDTEENSDDTGDNSDTAESSDGAEDNAQSAEPTTEEVSEYSFATDMFDAIESEQMFLLFVNRRLIYIYPKRCLEPDEQDKLREILKSKAIL